MTNKGLFTSNNENWGTPKVFFQELNKEFNFNLDVCATPENAKCKNYFTPEINGLNKEWQGVCFMNPPYGKKIKKWVEKAYTESRKNNCIIVGLLPARTDTRYFHDFIYNKSEIRFLKGRLKFEGGNSKNPAPFPSMIVIWRNNK